MTIYDIHHAQKNAPTINVDETEIDTTTNDLKYFGRRRLQYGEDMNQNILFILENFACPELNSNPGNPDLSIAVNTNNTLGGTDFSPLANPTDGQKWFNSSQQRIFVWDGVGKKWIPVGMQDDVAANWGIIFHGQYIPRPVSSKTGYVFRYDECSWIVSPYNYPEQPDYVACTTDATALVTSQYSPNGDSSIIPAFATYMIVGIKDNHNVGTLQPFPSATPTPAAPTPSATSGLPTPTPTPTPVVTPSATYAGILTAFFAPRFTSDGGTFPAVAGTVLPYYQGDNHRIKYPGITTKKYKILYTAGDGVPGALVTTPAPPRNPWTPTTDISTGDKVFSFYINNTPIGGSVGDSFDAQAAQFKIICMVSGKSTETSPPSQLIEGTDGAFFRVKSVTNLGTMTQVVLNVFDPSTTTGASALWNNPPIQTSPINVLRFNWDYMYVTEAYYQNFGLDESPFLINPPTAFSGAYDLYITGGKPPYKVINVGYLGPTLDGTYSTSRSNVVPNAIATGFKPTASPTIEPISFTHMSASHATDLANAVARYTDTTNSITTLMGSNSNIQQIPNGFVVRNFVTCDLNYPSNYLSVYGVGCQPEAFWHFQYNFNYSPDGSGPGGSSGVESGTSCSVTTGVGTNFAADSFFVTVQDSTSAIINANLGYGWVFQTIDADLMNYIYNFNLNATGGPAPGDTITAAGTYTYNLKPSLGTINTSIRPVVSPAQLQYVFSILDSVAPNSIGSGGSAVLGTPTRSGQYTYNTLNGVAYNTTGYKSLLVAPSSGLLVNVTNHNAMMHTGCSMSTTDPDLKCPSSGGYFGNYAQGPLSAGSAHQTITINKVWNNTSNSVVTLTGGQVITVTLAVTSNANNFNWTNLTFDRTSNHNRAFGAPYVPNDLTLSVTLPSGLNFSGSLTIPLFFGAYDNPSGGSSIGTSGGIGSVSLNFNNVT